MSGAPGALPPTLSAAVELFNEGRYLAAHELFEELWLATEGTEADFFKGFVQAAVAMHHLERGNLAGAGKLGRGHRRCLARYVPVHLGIDVEGFLVAMREALGGAASADRPLGPPRRPRIPMSGEAPRPGETP